MCTKPLPCYKSLVTGRTPLFYAERAGRTGLAYHLRRVGGHKSKPQQGVAEPRSKFPEQLLPARRSNL